MWRIDSKLITSDIALDNQHMRHFVPIVTFSSFAIFFSYFP